MHDTTLSVLDIRALEVGDNDEAVTIAMIVGIRTNFAGPDGSPIAFATDIYKVPLDKVTAQNLVAGLSEQIEKMPDPRVPSNLFIPGSPADVDREAEAIRRFTEGS
jgi:hypothetical protein